MATTVGQIETHGGKDDLRREMYFPTLVFSASFHDADELNDALVKAIYEERDKDQKGIERSNFRSLGGWHSHNHLYKDPKFKVLTDRIHRMGEGVSSNLGYHKGYKLEVTTMWSVINPPGSSNRAHVHPGAVWSGVYYVQAPESAGKIEFIEPRTEHLMNQPQYMPNKQRPKECWTKVKIEPRPGKILMFPSWLYHSVEPNLTEATGPASERIIISFNINQRRQRKK